MKEVDPAGWTARVPAGGIGRDMPDSGRVLDLNIVDFRLSGTQAARSVRSITFGTGPYGTLAGSLDTSLVASLPQDAVRITGQLDDA